MVLISDGADTRFIDTTNKLMKKGMCEKIKDDNINIIFIGIAYLQEKEIQKQKPDKQIKWHEGECVEKTDFYSVNTAEELKKALFSSVKIKTENNELGRNISK